jgi:hypothetical protein
MSVGTRHFTQFGLERLATDAPGSLGPVSAPSMTYAAAKAITNPPVNRRSPKLLSFVVGLNSRGFRHLGKHITQTPLTRLEDKK